MSRVEGKVALVTGAGRGQGRSHAVRLAEEGADVVVVDICADVPGLPYPLATHEDLDQTAELVRAAGGRCVTAVADVRDVAALRAAVRAGLDELGRLDVVVANAGVISSGMAWELEEDAWDVVVDVNLKGVWNTARAVVPPMLEQGTGGSFVVISSAAGLRGHVAYAHYVASKHGGVGLVKALANELAPHSIRVNSVHPTGVTGTGLSLSAPMEEVLSISPLVGLGMMNVLPVQAVDPIDVSNAVLWLASDESRYVTGLQLTVDAGTTVKP